MCGSILAVTSSTGPLLKGPKPPPCIGPPTEGLCPPPLAKVPFCLKMSKNHAEIKRKSSLESSKYKNSLGDNPPPPQTVHFSTFAFLPQVP